MSKAKELIEKARQRRENGEAIQTYWAEVMPGCGKLPDVQLQSWLGTYDFDTIVAGIDGVVVQRSKRDWKSDPMTPEQSMLYASAIMRTLRYKSLPEEERQAIAEKKEAIREARSVAGKRGAEARWHKPKDETVCHDLPSVATTLPATCSYTVTGSGSTSFSSSDAFSVSSSSTTTTSPSVGSKPSNPSPVVEKGRTDTGTKNQNPVGVRGAELESKDKSKTGKTKTLKKYDGTEHPKPEHFDSWPLNSMRIAWLKGEVDDNGEALPVTLDDDPEPDLPELGEEPLDRPSKRTLRQNACSECHKWNGGHKPGCSKSAAPAIDRFAEEFGNELGVPPL